MRVLANRDGLPICRGRMAAGMNMLINNSNEETPFFTLVPHCPGSQAYRLIIINFNSKRFHLESWNPDKKKKMMRKHALPLFRACTS